MPRGSAAKPGDTMVSQNGYHYTRTKTKWRLTHHIVAEEELGRSLQDNERVTFKDGDRTNISPDNIIVTAKKNSSLRKRLAIVEAKIAELQAERRELMKQIKEGGS